MTPDLHDLTDDALRRPMCCGSQNVVSFSEQTDR